MSEAEVQWVTAWAEFVDRLREDGIGKLPGFPVWADHFVREDLLTIPKATPAWKANFLRKNAQLYTRHQETIDAWLADWDDLAGFPRSRRKFEWQAQEAPDLWHTIMHFRPSGIRAKKPSYVPALVAITQTSVVAERRRRLTPVEGARLQGLPESFDFGEQPEAASYKQLGNGVSAGVVYHVTREAVDASRSVLANRVAGLVHAVDQAPPGIPYARNRYFGIA
jgi:DNA (cytosine-5)-methyltransferase 1